jgi:hypothetical protein
MDLLVHQRRRAAKKDFIMNVVFVFRIMALKPKFMRVDVLYFVYLNK